MIGNPEEMDAYAYGWLPLTDYQPTREERMKIETPEGRPVTIGEAALEGWPNIEGHPVEASPYRHVPNHEDWWYLASGGLGFLLMTPERRFVTQGYTPDGSPSVAWFSSLDRLYDFVDRATDPNGV